MAKRKKKSEDLQPLPENSLKNIAGGFGYGFGDLMRMNVKCPVEGCDFECRTFGEMNIHMRTKHPERC